MRSFCFDFLCSGFHTSTPEASLAVGYKGHSIFAFTHHLFKTHSLLNLLPSFFPTHLPLLANMFAGLSLVFLAATSMLSSTMAAPTNIGPGIVAVSAPITNTVDRRCEFQLIPLGSPS